ncbi:MAG: hypothetical protein KAT35_01175 [Candidatus Aenigmarchaeota archaeon]|nr:hypothetical protein [Candidatus Aenigmarchaeota archaeon]
MSLQELEKRVKALEERNRRVEGDKAWETSKTRKFVIAVFTYLAIALYLYAIDIPLPWLNAIVPTVGFLLSTLTFPFFRSLWLKHVHKK